MAGLFDPLTIRGLTLRNRVVMSPMCMYSAARDGTIGDWHLVHYPARAVGGAGLVIVEATAVEARGRLSEGDAGIWSDDHIAPWARIVELCHTHGAAVGVQLAHGGRKGFSTTRGVGPQPIVGPTDRAFDEGWRAPHPLAGDELTAIVSAFRDGARRAVAAGFDVVEIHGAHGYLLHQFLSPLVNSRADGYGGGAAGRRRLGLEVIDAVREAWPADRPLFYRASASDWVEGGLSCDDVAAAAVEWRAHGVDVVDCSSGGATPAAPPTSPGYQVPFAAQVRRQAGVATCAVGLITEPRQADAIVREEQADLVALGRALLRDPYWPLAASRALGVEVGYWPKQYLRARI